MALVVPVQTLLDDDTVSKQHGMPINYDTGSSLIQYIQIIQEGISNYKATTATVYFLSYGPITCIQHVGPTLCIIVRCMQHVGSV